VDDHCRGIQLVAEVGEPGEVYHIAGTAELTNLELTQRLLDELDASFDQVERVADRKGHDRRYSLDDGKLRALGYAPRMSFDEGISETVQWYVDNPSWWKPLRSDAQ
jgi:dTDP-glucose 4,6-dehydratase